MKSLSLKLTIILLLVITTVSAQNFKNASDYLEFVAKEQKTITQSMWRYTKAVAHNKNDRSINNKRKNLIKSIDRAILRIKKAKSYDGDSYKNQVLEHLNFNKNLLNQDYAKIIDMKAVAEQSYDLMEAYILAQEFANKKMEESQKNYERNFHDYATKHRIEIIENESDLGKKIDISNDVFTHYNDLYLIYFKVYINEVYLWEAVKVNDVSAIQQNANALNMAAKEGLDILKTIHSYKNDNSILLATQKVFEFFIDESKHQVPVITEFLILNEDFERIKVLLDQTPEHTRTQVQIDNYNKKVKDINKAADHYNKVNTNLNEQRQKIINDLYATNANFLSKHIPKD
ncbi:hypothetical protein [uncultured Psychroserpens sp.]|uniref:hypothetical protein n=1 Tax=uncultured Psychroserpens sp. TaxID=255436 RepID=UPI0026174EC3|nr:hypothetical protein [uncultured Psychroserpens sp.]